MLNDAYLALLKTWRRLPGEEGGRRADRRHQDGAPFLTRCRHADYEVRIRAMDATRVDIAIVTLTS
jgi:hypothetical protein